MNVGYIQTKVSTELLVIISITIIEYTDNIGCWLQLTILLKIVLDLIIEKSIDEHFTRKISF